MTKPTAHTPGPWKAERHSHIPGRYAIRSTSGTTVGHTWDADAARLIAAAPELLEALKDCANDLADMIKHHYRDTLDYPSQKQKYDADMQPVESARAAIAKATGDDKP